MSDIKIDFSPKCHAAKIHHYDPKYEAVNARLTNQTAQKALDAMQQGNSWKALLYAEAALLLKGGRLS